MRLFRICSTEERAAAVSARIRSVSVVVGFAEDVVSSMDEESEDSKVAVTSADLSFCAEPLVSPGSTA